MDSMLDPFTSMPREYRDSAGTMAVLGDSTSILETMKPGCIDLVFADPPYNIGKEFERKKVARDEYVAWCKGWIDQCMRILKPSGTMYLMAATQFMPYLDAHVEGKWVVKSRIVWHYDSSGVQARRHFGSMYEPILMIVKNE